VWSSSPKIPHFPGYFYILSAFKVEFEWLQSHTAFIRIGVKFSRSMFKGRVYEKWRAQTWGGVVAPRRRGAFGMEVCFGIKMILKRAKLTRGQRSGQVSKPFWLRGPAELLLSSRGASLPAVSSRSRAVGSPPLHPPWDVAGSCCVSGFLACLRPLGPILGWWTLLRWHRNLNFQM